MPKEPRRLPALTDSERATLSTWARSRSSTRARAQRAQIVLASAAGADNTAVAEELGVSRHMVGTWLARFLAEGLDGLAERPRPGRPAKVDDDSVARILVRLLTAPPAGARSWSTRAMAAESGLSQTTVSRIWSAYGLQVRAGRVPSADALPGRLPLEVRDVVGLFIAPPVRVLALTARDPGSPRRRRPASGTPSLDRPSLDRPSLDRPSTQARNLFATADSFTTLRGGSTARATTGEPSWRDSLRDFLNDLDQSAAPNLSVHLLVGGEATPWSRPTIEAWTLENSRFQGHFAHFASGSAWLGGVELLLAGNPLLSHETAPGLGSALPGLRDDLHTWCAGWSAEAVPFRWQQTYDSSSQNPEHSPTSNGRYGRHGRHANPEAVDDALEMPDNPPAADPVVRTVREELLSVRRPSAERVREAPLAAQLGLSRGAIRKALHALADEGLLERLPQGGAAYPHVDVNTIVDLYAARSALGAVLIHRAAMLDQRELRPVRAALSEVRSVARAGRDHARIGDADLSFQDAIAATANLPQSSLFFQRLTMRLRMFLSIVQLGFPDSAVDLIAREDAVIFEAIREGDGDEAARLWRVKVERSVRYMVTQLPDGHFDPNLWLALAGKPTPRPGDPRKSASGS
ncbi:helix-turn-helix domain-containing protein [Streptomyces sp. B-S-A8]|uniref:Helix-turn-helix domain-containing protein n=1 Tax=Streptomyces solicavernae TaxID=3043614 RepID=A0ABT6RU37_9ACTN|nr:helix-turn-helix domain-containing protein [Streptomyces sp. B-S-A8]MDI3387944.1 helix-turn-helix domain-containing protein [Streptomyces sp. B-S-A8]